MSGDRMAGLAASALGLSLLAAVLILIPESRPMMRFMLAGPLAMLRIIDVDTAESFIYWN